MTDKTIGTDHIWDLSPEEYDTLVQLHGRASRAAEARWDAYAKATNGIRPYRYGNSSPEYITFNARGDRPGRDPDGRYDIVLTFRDYEGDQTDVSIPSAILWDPEGITAKVVADIKAKEEADRIEAEAARARYAAENAADAEKREKRDLRRLARKHGFELTPKGSPHA